MSWLPISLNLQAWPILLIGGGQVAERKFRLLQQMGAKISILAPDLTPLLREALANNAFEYIAGTHEKLTGMEKNYKVWVSATNNSQINSDVAKLAKVDGTLVNVVDNIDLSTFIFPAIVDRNPVSVAISTSGLSPVLACFIREKLEVMLPKSLGRFANQLAKIRNRLKQSGCTGQVKRRVQKQLISDYFTGHSSLCNLDEADIAAISKRQTVAPKHGEVILVGAGPGDPELLTIKAMRILQNCDVILFDNLVNREILEYARRDAEVIYVGKKAGACCNKQSQINQLMLDHAQQGNLVVRLKGGDPHIFARANEEIEFLADNDIKYQIIPGISAAFGCAASMKVSLTDREYAHGCMFISAHLSSDSKDDVDWEQLAKLKTTLVFYMGVSKISYICKQLLANGVASDTRMAIVENGTMMNEKVYYGTLDYFYKNPQLVVNVCKPALLFVGNVLQFYDRGNDATSTTSLQPSEYSV